MYVEMIIVSGEGKSLGEGHLQQICQSDENNRKGLSVENKTRDEF